MVSSSKILTVSYGTFSCTAEGFDDPLAAVKEATQYFREVVRAEPHFGAEPQQLDPEMVNDLFRDQISAQAGGGKLTLNAPLPAAAVSAGALGSALAAGAHALPDDDTIEAAARAADLVEEAEAAADAKAYEDAPEPEISDALSDSVADAGAEAAPAPQLSDPAGVAAKLQRIRDVVSGNAEDPAEEPQDEAATAGDDTDFDDSALTGMLGALDAGDEDADDVVDEALAVEMAGDEDESAADEDDLLGDTLASLVQSTAYDDVAAPDAPAMAEAEDDTEEASGDDALAATLAAFEDDAEEDDLIGADTAAAELAAAFDLDEDEDDFEDAEDSIANILAETDEEDEGDDFAWDNDVEDDDAADIADTLLAAEADDEEDDADWAGFGEADWDGPADTDALAAAFAEDADIEDTEDAPAPAPEPAPAPAAPLRARVVKVKRAVFDEAVRSGQLEEVDEDEDDLAPLPGTSSLSDDEEDELARELAAVKAELSDDFNAWDDEDEDEETVAPAATGWDEDDLDDEDEDDVAAAPAPLRLDNPVAPPTRNWDTDLDALDARAARASAALHGDEDSMDIDPAALECARKAVKMASPARAMLTEQTIEDNDASRILDQTNTEMAEPEGNRRRSAIAHLRAAVAATKADRLLGRRASADDAQEPYREDLATVVRPRRPQPTGTRTERPVTEPSPLKLVAEQRIGQKPAASTPVRPRRVSRPAASAAPADAAADPQDGPGGFADYAERVGARELSELLEAAAAYMSFVEGREQFSRPQLMTTVREAEVTESSREDRLRSFGELLRDGKIEKTSGGRFTASERISFKPSRRAG